MVKFFKVIFASILTAAFFNVGTAEAQSNYKIRSGDTLAVEVLEDSGLNRSVLVLPDGSISFPLAGGVRAAGRTTTQVAAALASGLASNFANQPNVYVSVASLRERVAAAGGPVAPATQDIYITGEINNPGKIQASPGVTVLQAIAQAGGLTRFAAGKRIQLRRGNKIYQYNYFTNGGTGISGNTALAKGDVIIVPQRRLFE